LLIVFAFAAEADRDKFAYLYDKYKNLLFRKAWEILRDDMLAEDAVSEAYIRVYRNLGKVEDPDSPRSVAFLATIVRNAALTIYGKNKAEIPDEFEEDRADPQVLEDMAAANISSERIYRIIGNLDEPLRNLFVLKYAYDIPHKEIADQMGITENSVNVKLHRVRKLLAEAVRNEKDANAQGW
jgi:RNA polymerase sigma-70 factor (ECF subfamily)